MQVNENLKFAEHRIIKYVWIAIYAAVLIWSGINPKDPLTWFLEVSPAMVGGVVLLVTYNSFRLTPVLYWFIWKSLVDEEKH